MNMQKIKWVLVLASLALLTGSQFAYAEDAAPTFEVSKAKTSEKAVVDSATKTFEVTMESVVAADYMPTKRFDLIVGGCTLSVKGTKTNDNPRYEITGSQSGDVYNPKSFKVADGKLVIEGQEEDEVNDGQYKDKPFEFCTDADAIKFEPYPSDESKSLITVELKGLGGDAEKIPPSLKLTSKAPVFNETEAQAGDKKKDEGSNTGLVVGLVVGGIVIVLVLVGGGLGLYFFLKNKKQQTVDREKSQEPPQGDEAPSKTKGDEAPSKTKTKGDGEADTSHKGSAKGKKRAEESVQAAPPKVPKP